MIPIKSAKRNPLIPPGTDTGSVPYFSHDLIRVLIRAFGAMSNKIVFKCYLLKKFLNV